MKKIHDHLKGVLATTNALIVGALVCTPALAADETPAAPAAGEPAGLEEVVVTAEKREATASKTAISMDVLNPDRYAVVLREPIRVVIVD